MNDWQRFFDTFAPRYDAEIFTQNTENEVRFIVERLRPPAKAAILDLGCGTGRHSVGLAARGYRVTGVDLSPGMLEVAQRRAEAAGVSVEWVRADAAEFSRPGSFDLAVCLCEGAMCLLGADDDPLERDLLVLRNLRRSLRPGGRLLLNVLNACRLIRMYRDEDVAAGRFDVVNLTEQSEVAGLLADGAAPPPSLEIRERGYTVPELHRMLRWAGFQVRGIHGGTAGDWNLQTPKLDEYELMAIAEKPVTGTASDTR